MLKCQMGFSLVQWMTNVANESHMPIEHSICPMDPTDSHMSNGYFICPLDLESYSMSNRHHFTFTMDPMDSPMPHGH
jgi:hypothetical protein